MPFVRQCGYAPCSASATRRRFLAGATGQPASIRQKPAAESSGSEGNRIVCSLETKRERMGGSLGPADVARCLTGLRRAASSRHFQCGRRALQTIRSDVLRKKCGCPLTLAGPAVPPPRVSPLAKATRSKSWRGAAGVTGGRTAGKGWRSGEAVKKGSARRSRRQAKKAPAVVAGGCRQEVFLPDRPALVRKLW